MDTCLRYFREYEVLKVYSRGGHGAGQDGAIFGPFLPCPALMRVGYSGPANLNIFKVSVRGRGLRGGGRGFVGQGGLNRVAIT